MKNFVKAQSDSDSSSVDVELNNSATEISTDSEFDHDPINRDPPKILIDDSHLRKNATRVQVKQAIIENGVPSRNAQLSSSRKQHQNDLQTKFKPLIEVDPTIVLSTNKMPLKNPFPGDYLLSKTASTEGIASKKSLELKKRYLLGETGGSGVLKSDSASALDNKLKSFHSNISECQKLLNPGNEISPSMQTFLQRIDRKNEINKSNLSIELNKEKKDQSNSEEKENRSIDSNKKIEFSETINTTLIENKIKSIDKESKSTSIETINLVTPEKSTSPIIDLTKVDIPKSTIENNKKFIENMEKSDNDKTLSENNMKIKTKLDSIFIDLTGDSPVKDRSLVETNVNFNKKFQENSKNHNSNNNNVVPDIISNITSVNGKPSENVIQVQVQMESTNESKDAESIEMNSERSRSPAHETTIEVPQLWNSSRSKNSCNKSDNDVDTDSLSNSDDNSSNSSSSLEDIPHFILDSTTSPETQNENLIKNFSSSNGSSQAPPRLEVRDTSGELMQLDSLMIIDGQYIGDPADLALYEKIPDKDSDSTSTTNSPQEIENPQTPVTAKDIRETPKESPKKESSPEKHISPEKEKGSPREKISYVRNSPERVAFSKEMTQKPFYSRESPRRDSPEKSTQDTDTTSIPSTVTSPFSSLRPVLKFDTKNENKIDTLKNLPLILPNDEEKKIKKPTMLRFNDKISPMNSPDTDKTPIAGGATHVISDSETEMTGPGLTETELSDWAADDAVSENFVDDIEFAMNSNKGTIKRNKKKMREQNQMKRVPKHNQAQKAETECGILKNLALDEIEFMDTGSEDSIVESATNKVMMKNRGYVEFVEKAANNVNNYNYYKQTSLQEQVYQMPVVEAINKEVAGIDYIEQGACILSNDNDLKTPMNEPLENFDSLSKISDTKEQFDSLNVEQDDDIDEDSLVIQTESKCNESNTTTATNTIGTTTEESDLLTIVTSPMETPPKNENTTTPTTPTNNTGTSENSSPDKMVQKDEARKVSSSSYYDNTKVDETTELGYEEYVKSLQAKIAQISSNSGRDSLEGRKSRRKLSKSDASNNSIDKGKDKECVSLMSIFQRDGIPQIEPPQTLTRKLEEISKERVKQKDIIHDLVMDKLQAKKQINAERRLNRSRNRSMFLGNSNNSLTSPSSTISLASTTGGDIPPISPTYGQIKNPVIPRVSTTQNKNKDDIERRHSIHTTPPKNTMVQNKENVLSDVSLNANKLNKTQSFCVYTTKQIPLKDTEKDFSFKNPQPPPRQYKTYESPTEKLRQEARERARFKSNQDLGLSPDEKIQQMRKKYNVNGNGAEYVSQATASGLNRFDKNQSDDMKFREMKMSVSKSYNDISLMKKFAMESNENIQAYNYKRVNEFVSDPNLIDTIEKEQSNSKDNTISATGKKPLKATRRDSERRKSLIQTVSDFFYKKKDSASNKDLTANGSPNKDKDKESSSSMFSRFRLSPKSKDNKEKAKEKAKTPPYDRCKSENCLKNEQQYSNSHPASPDRIDTHYRYQHNHHHYDEIPPPIPPLPVNYQRSDDESGPSNEPKNELKKLRAMSKASRQAELKRLRIAQEIKREQDEIEVQIKELETRGVEIEKTLRGEGQNLENLNDTMLSQIGSSDEELLKELLEIWRHITQLKKRDEELSIRQQELQLEHRHAELKEELNMRLSCSKLDKSGADVAIEGAILSEMLEIVAKRAALRPSDTGTYDSSYTPVSLPILPPNTTQNPLQQYNTANGNNNSTPSISSTTSSTLTNRFLKQHSYPGSGGFNRQRPQKQHHHNDEDI